MFIGIDIGGTNIKGILADKNGKILKNDKVATPSTAAEIDNAINDLSKKLANSANVKFSKIKAIGIGAAGAINSKKGIVLHSPNIPAWNKYPLANKVSKLTGKPVFIENDAAVALMGEWWQGNGSKYTDWIMLTLGTGIGGGAIVNGQILKGRDGYAAEFGHITIDYKGKDCPCGGKGCFEIYGSANAMVSNAKALLKKFPNSNINKRLKDEKLSSHMICEEAAKGDEMALEAVKITGNYLGIGISSLINTFNPQAVIIGGGLSRSLKLLLPSMQDAIDERAFPGIRDKVKFHAVKHEDKGPALGAIKLAMDQLVLLKKTEKATAKKK